MTNERTSFEKYTSHTLFSKGLRKGWCWFCARGQLETEQTATYWPQVLLAIAALLSHSAGLLNRGPEGPSPLSGAGSHNGILSPTATGTRTVTATRTELCLPRSPTNSNHLWHLIITCFLWASHLHRIQPSTGKGDILISLNGCSCFLIDGLVEGQYVTNIVLVYFLVTLYWR